MAYDKARPSSPVFEPIWRWSVAALVAAACVYPTEKSQELSVEMEVIPELLRGESHQLVARLMDPAGSPVGNAEVLFSSSDNQVAFVDTAGVLVGVSVGTVEITATALGFAEAAPAIQPVRIHDLIEIDSVRPRITSYGQLVDIHGTGLNPHRIFAVALGAAEATIEGEWLEEGEAFSLYDWSGGSGSLQIRRAMA